MPTLTKTINTSRLLVTKLRGQDYVHAGGEESIEMVVQKVLSYDASIKMKKTLDVGCGFGGTANYLYQQGFKDVYGIDLDEAAIIYAIEKYPLINFTNGSALDVDQIYSSNYFSFLYMFNVIYAIQDKVTLLKKLSAISKPGAILAVFDYAQGEKAINPPLKDLADKPMYPLQIEQFKKALTLADWEILEIMNLTPHYVGWYKTMFNKLSNLPPLLKKQFLPRDISKVKENIILLTELLEQGALGGTVIYAKKQG